MLETIRCISKFEQIVATVPFYTRASFDIVWYSINKSTICRPPKYRDFPDIKKFHLRSPIESAGLPPENGIFFICMRSEKISVFSPKKPDIILLCLSGLKGRNKYLAAKHRKIYFFIKPHIKCMGRTVRGLI